MELISALVSPTGPMNILSHTEVHHLHDGTRRGLHEMLRQCALAALTSDVDDDPEALLDMYRQFDIHILQERRGIKLQLTNAPGSAFVDGKLIKGIRQNLFSVLRDIVYVSTEMEHFINRAVDSREITDLVFRILRNAQIFRTEVKSPNVVVCWGGHSIGNEEYDYTKEVGYQLGLRRMNICTGCGPGAMKGPMKGANLGHAKQRVKESRFIGITEPGIISAEAPNPIVNELVIMPDIEKRLEAFVRIGHGLVVFPGGAGTAEELLYILGILLHPDNQHLPYPLILTGPECSRAYFDGLDTFIKETLGDAAREKYKIIIDDPVGVAREITDSICAVMRFRRKQKDSYYFNWHLKIPKDFQLPFEPSHEHMATLNLDLGQSGYEMAINLRRAMSGIVAGNVKINGIRAINDKGPFQLRGHPQMMKLLDQLLTGFVEQNRMKLPGKPYVPCYELVL
jgi:predicted Rossmann-fold nucleotide-binding protein